MDLLWAVPTVVAALGATAAIVLLRGVTEAAEELDRELHSLTGLRESATALTDDARATRRRADDLVAEARRRAAKTDR